MANTREPQLVLFDCYGVLCTPPHNLTIDQFITDPALAADTKARLKLLDLGKTDEEAAVKLMAERSGLSEAEVWNHMRANAVVNLELIEYIRDQVKPRYRIGLLSNAARATVEWTIGDHLQLFDDVFISEDIGMIKPSDEIFEYVLAHVDVAPADITSFDDIQENVDAEKRFGIHAVQYTSLDDVRAELGF